MAFLSLEKQYSSFNSYLFQLTIHGLSITSASPLSVGSQQRPRQCSGVVVRRLVVVDGFLVVEDLVVVGFFVVDVEVEAVEVEAVVVDGVVGVVVVLVDD
ncbi:unnamed protein product, partial [Nippostrongylus brasiliensis]|uniref:Uncharacterized protein n=1 Tax=Nippostrongylus brasiliensis TaxID=27835 RepID=A0A0N4Y4T7_NIPBR